MTHNLRVIRCKAKSNSSFSGKNKNKTAAKLITKTTKYHKVIVRLTSNFD